MHNGVNFYVLFGILLLYFLIIFSFKLWHHPFHFLKFHKWRQFSRTLLFFLDFSPYFSSFIRIFYEITDFWHHKQRANLTVYQLWSLFLRTFLDFLWLGGLFLRTLQIWRLISRTFLKNFSYEKTMKIFSAPYFYELFLFWRYILRTLEKWRHLLRKKL